MTRPVLVIGGNGKTGGRVVQMLRSLDVPVRGASRSTSPAFDWDDAATWSAAIENVSAIYVTYQPDLAVPGAREAVKDLTQLALERGVRRIVLLSGRGEEEAQAVEDDLMRSGADWTVLRCAWFNQNFSEGQFLDLVRQGEVALPVSTVREPFVDADDIAEIAVKALTEDRHVGKLYELTGPDLISFSEAVAEIASASGNEIRFTTIDHDAFISGAKAAGTPDDIVWLLNELFARVLDGRNESLADGVEQALGREPKSFAAFARETAARGVWR